MAAPFLVLWAICTMILVQNGGSIGIKPKRYTIEWMQANKERERIENTNPVSRYLDRRKYERAGNWLAQYTLPWHPYFIWMRDSHDPDFPEYYAKYPTGPHLHWTDDITQPNIFKQRTERGGRAEVGGLSSASVVNIIFG